MVLLDSNFLILPISKKVDVFLEIENLLSRRIIFTVIPPIIDELKKISQRTTKIGKYASTALKFTSKCKILEIEDKEILGRNVDDIIVDFSIKKNIIVATTDINLKKRLRKMNIPVIYLRDHSRLELDGCID